VLLFTGILYIFSGVTEMFIIYKHTPKNHEMRFFKEISEGVSFVWKNRGLRFLFTFAVVINFLASPLFMVVFPYFARVIFKFSSSQYGTLQVFGTLGALIGNFSIILFFKNIRSKYLILTGLLVQSILLVLFSVVIMPAFGLSSIVLYWVNISAIFLIEFFNILVNIPINANLQILVPSNYRSRVFSVLEFIAMSMVPISSLIYGFLIDKVSPFLFFLSVNILTLFVSIIFVIIAPEESYEPIKFPTTEPTKESIG
ncbi:MAG: MFS transporter, partial [Fervidobacterium sp.]